MSEPSILQGIIATALIGTQRQAFTPIRTDGNLGQLLANVDTTNQESALLSTVAIVTMYQQAGQLPITNQQFLIPEPCELDDLPRCSDRTGYYLSLMLNGEHQQLLPELLDLLANLGQRVHETSLPSLLDLGKRQSDVREAIAKVLGKRGQWLAAQNPEWNYVASEEESVWETGSKAARLMWLTKLRRQEPDQARQLLESTWKQESASDRTAFLEILGTGLSMADEPFLEALLDDRSKEVRRITIHLLTCLPESRFCQRAIARVQDLIKLHHEGNQQYFTVDLPEVHTPEMLRDGIETKSNDNQNDQIGDRGSWFLSSLAVTSLSLWTQKFEITIPDLVKIAMHPRSDALIAKGWKLVAQKTGNLIWLYNLLTLGKDNEIDKITHISIQSINHALEKPIQQVAKLQILRDHKLKFGVLYNMLILTGKPIWDKETNEIVMAQIIAEVEELSTNYKYIHPHNYWTICVLIKDIPKHITPLLIPQSKSQMFQALQSLQETTPTFTNSDEERNWNYVKQLFESSIKQFVDLLQIRQEMLESITGEGVSL